MPAAGSAATPPWPDDPLTSDHVVPRAHGGPTVPRRRPLAAMSARRRSACREPEPAATTGGAWSTWRVHADIHRALWLHTASERRREAAIQAVFIELGGREALEQRPRRAPGRRYAEGDPATNRMSDNDARAASRELAESMAAEWPSSRRGSDSPMDYAVEQRQAGPFMTGNAALRRHRRLTQFSPLIIATVST